MDTLDIVEVSRLLRITPKTARNRLNDGRPMPPFFVVGRRRLFLREEVHKWLRSQPGALFLRSGHAAVGSRLAGVSHE